MIKDSQGVFEAGNLFEGHSRLLRKQVIRDVSRGYLAEQSSRKVLIKSPARIPSSKSKQDERECDRKQNVNKFVANTKSPTAEAFAAQSFQYLTSDESLCR